MPKTLVQLRTEINKERNDEDHMQATIIIEGNRHEIQGWRTIEKGDPNRPKGEFQIIAGDGIGE